MGQEPELRRVLGPFSAASVVIGAIIGVGIFFNPSIVVRLTGSGSLALLAWGVGGLIALLGALTFSELGGLRSSSGAQYEILRDAYGVPPAFVFVFCNATAVQAGAIAVIAVICAEHLGLAVGGTAPQASSVVLLSAVLICGVTVANAVGVRLGAGIQNVTVLCKLVTLLLVTLLAATFEEAPPAAPVPDPPQGHPVALLFAGLVPALFAFGGWQHGLWIGGEVKDPQRNVPRAITGGVLVVVTVYLLVNWAYLQLLGEGGVATSQALAADAIGRWWPGGGSRLVAAAVGLSAFGVLNAQLLSGPRLVYGMARDGRFFRVFAGVHARLGTPLPAILLLGGSGLTILLALATDRKGTEGVINGVVLVDSVFFVLTGFALILLRRKMPDAPRPVRVPLYPWVPLLFVVGEMAVIVGSFLADAEQRRVAWLGVAWIGAAVLLFVCVFRRSRA